MTGRQTLRPAVVGIAGAALLQEEQALFRELPPAGIILFARNCIEPAQLRALVRQLRELSADRHLPLFVDQEGGRVQRLRPPHWPDLPPAATIGGLFARDRAAGERAARLWAGAIAAELREVGIDVACGPVLDLRFDDTTPAIGDRSFGSDPETVAALGWIICQSLLAAGIKPVIKHLPGHGRARVDSHLELPRVVAPRAVLESTDFVPFRVCRDAPFAMTCHCLFEALDPDRPASLSPRLIREVIRGTLGCTGVLLSDDLAMGALDGTPADRVRAALAAGNDLVLWCDGDIGHTADVLAALPPIAPTLGERLVRLCDRQPSPWAGPSAWDLAARLADAISAADVRDP